MKNVVIIPAGSHGETFGGALPRIFYNLGGKTILMRAVNSFEKSPLIESIIVVVSPEWREFLLEKIEEFQIKKVQGIVEAGATRRDSVFNALQTDTARGADNILISGPDRPFVSPSLIESVIKGLEKYTAVIPALPLGCPVKEVDKKGMVVKTLTNRYLFIPQSPQGFRREAIINSYSFAMEEMLISNDDSTYAELNRLNPKQIEGYDIKVIAGQEDNISVKTKRDLKIAELILKEKELSFK